ncbi:aminobenzoyl-glutamate transport protein [Nocardioides alpinus]|uniref:Aminobenzoyl-glutamate transport protein n=1 Tax=Nocardioides alpinus TaxID=748909 RepID=A0A1I1ANG2_9ACTN|nr:AbgT family transporter [Nocardioides alpinus]PKH41770.1 p-aminobenzoyl-glutamate transporter [Nocardioides alpinus]SFB37998.1 aminobenzoyl-glutamate transport protein [Nocardioides alpinus]
MANTDVAPGDRQKRTWLDRIESLGNKVPHPAMIFLGLCILVIVLSWVLAFFDVAVTYDVAEAPGGGPDAIEGGSQGIGIDYPDPDDVVITQETTAIESLLSVEGIRFLFTSLVSNFSTFSVVAVILVAMLGVGVAEESGLMGALIRKLVAIAPPWAITAIIVFVGMISSIASDAGYLILIPLAAAAFHSVGKHPLAGLAAAYAGVSAGFAVNILITPSDGILTEVTNEAIALADPALQIGITANLWFNIVSTLFVTVVIVFVSSRLIEKRLGAYDPSGAQLPTEGFADPGGAGTATETAVDQKAESRGLRGAGLAVLASLVVVLLLSLPTGAPLRNAETGSLIEDAPLMESLIVIITLIFLAAGIGYGRAAKTIASSTDVINAITKTWASLAGLLFMLFLIAQFIAYFNYSNMPTVISVATADLLESADIGAVWLLIGFILVIALLDIIIPGLLPKWAIFAPIFIPLFIRLDVAPQTLLAAYRLGDSPMNVITPLMVYLPFIVLVAQRYQRSAGLGTVIALMIPYSFIVLVTWLAFFVVWFLLGIPMGPGYPANL